MNPLPTFMVDQWTCSIVDEWLRRRRAAAIARYRMSGSFTALELLTIEAMWVEGLGVRQLAKRLGTSAAAVSDRVQRLAKARELWTWWRLKNLCRCPNAGESSHRR